MIVTFLVLLIAGIACLTTGLLVWKKERITLIHSYHYPFVKDEDKKAYTAGIGKAVYLMGVGCILAGFVNLITGSEYGWLLFAIGFLGGWILILLTQHKYNRGI